MTRTSDLFVLMFLVERNLQLPLLPPLHLLRLPLRMRMIPIRPVWIAQAPPVVMKVGKKMIRVGPNLQRSSDESEGHPYHLKMESKLIHLTLLSTVSPDKTSRLSMRFHLLLREGEKISRRSYTKMNASLTCLR